MVNAGVRCFRLVLDGFLCHVLEQKDKSSSGGENMFLLHWLNECRWLDGCAGPLLRQSGCEPSCSKPKQEAFVKTESITVIRESRITAEWDTMWQSGLSQALWLYLSSVCRISLSGVDPVAYKRRSQGNTQQWDKGKWPSGNTRRATENKSRPKSQIRYQEFCKWLLLFSCLLTMRSVEKQKTFWITWTTIELQDHYVEYAVQPVCNVHEICTHLNINTGFSGDRYGFYTDGWPKEFW